MNKKKRWPRMLVWLFCVYENITKKNLFKNLFTVVYIIIYYYYIKKNDYWFLIHICMHRTDKSLIILNRESDILMILMSVIFMLL